MYVLKRLGSLLYSAMMNILASKILLVYVWVFYYIGRYVLQCSALLIFTLFRLLATEA